MLQLNVPRNGLASVLTSGVMPNALNMESHQREQQHERSCQRQRQVNGLRERMVAIVPVARAVRLRNQRIQSQQQAHAENGEGIKRAAPYPRRPNCRRPDTADHNGVDHAHRHPSKLRDHDGNGQMEHAAYFGAEAVSWGGSSGAHQNQDRIRKDERYYESRFVTWNKLGCIGQEPDRVNVARTLEIIWRDTLYAARTMRKNPMFAATAVLVLALGIGGNTAMFTVIRAVLLKPLNYRDADRLFRISGGATPARFEEMKTSQRSFSGIAAFTAQETLTLAGGPAPEVVTGARVSAGFLQILGVDPLLGRGFLPAEDSPGGAPVVMISSELWNRRFGRDPRIAGKTAIFAAAPYTIIGVLPPRFEFPFPGVDVWMTRPSEWSLMPPKSRLLSPFLTIFGRLKPGLSLAQANAEMTVIHRRYALAHPAMLDARQKSAAEVSPMKDELVARVRSMLWMLFGAVGFVLLIACGNMASLLLARASSRAREFAVRSALGAARTRLIGQLLAESVLLSSAGGVLGVLLASWCLRAIPAMTAVDLPRAGEIRLDWMVLVFAAALSFGTGVLFGLAPSLGASQPDLIRVLRGSGESANKGAPRRFLGGSTAAACWLLGK